MPRLLILGATTPAGDAFLRQAEGDPDLELAVAGRRPPPDHPGLPFLFCDLSDPAPPRASPAAWLEFSRLSEPLLLVSFAPIWHLAPFLARLLNTDPGWFGGMAGVVACSSSSVLTKRYASNGFDRSLVRRLSQAEHQLQASCEHHGLAWQILAPTLIYGRSGSYADRNLSQLMPLLQRLPFLPVPKPTGLRQPIHCSQLAAVALQVAREQMRGKGSPAAPGQLPRHLPLGGDDTLSYQEMMERLQQLAKGRRPARLVPVPARLIYTLAAPLLLVSPKRFEAVLRMGADLSGFRPVHELLQRDPEPFPVQPLLP